MKKTIKDIIEIAEKIDWHVTKEDNNNFLFSKYSPAGQDFSFYAQGKNAQELTNNIYEAYNNFDPSYETYIWLDNTGHGINGSPYNMKDIYYDMEWCQNQILELFITIDERLTIKEILEKIKKQDSRQKLILQDLQQAYDCLNNVFVDIRIENTERQFDFVTSPNLSNLFDNIKKVTKDLEKIIYQE